MNIFVFICIMYTLDATFICIWHTTPPSSDFIAAIVGVVRLPYTACFIVSSWLSLCVLSIF